VTTRKTTVENHFQGFFSLISLKRI